MPPRNPHSLNDAEPYQAGVGIRRGVFIDFDWLGMRGLST